MRTAVEVDLHLNRLIWAEKRVELNWLLKILILPRSTEKIRLHGAYTTLNLTKKEILYGFCIKKNSFSGISHKF